MPMLIGSRIPRLEDEPLLRGQGRFIDDVVVPGVLHAGFVRSPHPHAAIRGVAKDAALALAPLAGKYNAYLFAFGLLNASLFAASILPLSTAYSVCEGMGWEIGVNKKFTEAPQFYGLYTLIIFISMGFVLLPDFPLIKIMYLSQVLNGLVLPFILIFMLMLVNDRELMGEYVNGRWANLAGGTCIAVMILLSIVLVLSPLFT